MVVGRIVNKSEETVFNHQRVGLNLGQQPLAVFVNRQVSLNNRAPTGAVAGRGVVDELLCWLD